MPSRNQRKLGKLERYARAPSHRAPPSSPAHHLPTEFHPFIAPEQHIPELTPKAIVLGAVFGILFGASTVYLALRAGLTVSASIPIAVLSIAVFKRFGKS